MSRVRRSIAAAALLLAASLVAVPALVASSTESAATASASKPTVKLRFTYSNGTSKTSSVSTLTCTSDGSKATGYLRNRVAAGCSQARRSAAFLASMPDTTRPCTQIFGGNQKARIRGTVGSRSIDRRFARTDGCEIADWDRAGALLPRVR